MTLVRNRLLPLSGNKILLFVAIALLTACSPKLRPVATPVKPADTVKRPVEVKPRPSQQAGKALTTTISLLLPFYLDELNLDKGAGRAGIAKANLAVEYYQGFKLALDSLTADGYNYKLQVFDTKDVTAQAYNLALNTKVRTSNIIVGPVYPEEIKSFAGALGNLKRMMVSPLSPASPAEYHNNNLVTMVPPLEYHCREVAGYIQHAIKPTKVFVLRSGYTEDLKYTRPFKRAIDSLSKKHIKVVELTVVRGNLASLLPQLSHTAQNVFVIPSTNQQFVQVTLHALDQLVKQHYPVALFGHPNWEGAGYLKAEQMQRLNAYITSSDRVNYKSAQAIKFLKAYRRAYHAEPNEFAIKGFDEGMCLGRLAGKFNNARYVQITNRNILNFITADEILSAQNFAGIHSSFHFVEIPGSGFVNTSVRLYKYANFDLKPVE